LCQDPAFIEALKWDVHWLNQGIIDGVMRPEEIATMNKARQQEVVQAIHIKYLKEVAQDSLPSEVFAYPYEEIKTMLSEQGEDSPEYALLLKWESLLEVKRTVAKGNSFGPLYGQTPEGFAMLNKISIDEAKRRMEIDKKTYPVKHAWIAETIARARKDCFVKSVFGKRRHLDYKRYRNDEKECAALDRRAVNTKIQGPASDLNLLATYEIIKQMKSIGMPVLTVATIHDSTEQDIRPDVIEEAVILTQKIISETPIALLGDRGVPFKADTKLGPTWGTVKKWKPKS
jgi:hypothetical protein